MTDWTGFYEATGEELRATRPDNFDHFEQPGLRALQGVTCFTRHIVACKAPQSSPSQ